eukprot:10153691-Lingulodinium_polyedra.AAC.1
MTACRATSTLCAARAPPKVLSSGRVRAWVSRGRSRWPSATSRRAARWSSRTATRCQNASAGAP